mmetsp:Transcript_26770/g.49186  ORF Transcript_26770/g.49186 Transcript_26770/m.49186 type:complete len:155 (-) Transcript_26770:450-914(-)
MSTQSSTAFCFASKLSDRLLNRCTFLNSLRWRHQVSVHKTNQSSTNGTASAPGSFFFCTTLANDVTTALKLCSSMIATYICVFFGADLALEFIKAFHTLSLPKFIQQLIAPGVIRQSLRFSIEIITCQEWPMEGVIIGGHCLAPQEPPPSALLV